MNPEELSANLLEIRRRMAVAAAASGRTLDGVRLIAVSKFHSAADVAAAARLGQLDFGENYMQEARAKQAECAALLADDPHLAASLRWHAIGALQTNKAKEAAGHFTLIHTVDSPRLAQALARRCSPDAPQPVLLQVNIGDEPQKAGVAPDQLEELALHVLTLPELRLEGLMCLPPAFDDPEGSRPFFARLRQLCEKLRPALGLPLPHLSMGMSGDYMAAIEEGATLVRIGTAIFGARHM